MKHIELHSRNRAPKWLNCQFSRHFLWCCLKFTLELFLTYSECWLLEFVASRLHKCSWPCRLSTNRYDHVKTLAFNSVHRFGGLVFKQCNLNRNFPKSISWHLQDRGVNTLQFLGTKKQQATFFVHFLKLTSGDGSKPRLVRDWRRKSRWMRNDNALI